MSTIKEAPLSEAEVKELQKLKNDPDVALARKENERNRTCCNTVKQEPMAAAKPPDKM